MKMNFIRIAFLGTSLVLCGYVRADYKQPIYLGKFKGSSLSLRQSLDKELQRQIESPIPHIYAKIPLEKESFPEMSGSKIWNYYYNYDIHNAEVGRHNASGYSVALGIKNCDPNPFKGNCTWGGFSGDVNTIDDVNVIDFGLLFKEPITNNGIPLAYGINGYIRGGPVDFLYKTGHYYINGSRYPLENVILANAANVDLKDPKGPNYNKPFGGTVGQKLKLNMQLRRSGKWLWGTYAYNLGKPVAVQDRLYVVGSVAPDGVASLREYSFDNQNNKANQTGLFRGKLVGDKTFSGTWSTPDGKKTLLFSLQAK